MTPAFHGAGAGGGAPGAKLLFLLEPVLALGEKLLLGASGRGVGLVGGKCGFDDIGFTGAGALLGALFG